ncbi:hypothetical protein RGQ29_024300 [Quercus rubra]|uniref:Uncharacterized protein n=1 Tax=Quercus rubra TaxID=3512 RepID=A0AAN7EV08_QUERU|nr:hypothetical protein RGQ29_024300 [Quercus rubra]
MEEERLRELREAQDDVTKKSDLSDFYFNIGKNVAFGAKDAEVRRSEKQVESKKPVKPAKSRELEKLELKGSDDTSDEGQSPNASNAPLKVLVMEDKHQECTTIPISPCTSIQRPWILLAMQKARCLGFYYEKLILGRNLCLRQRGYFMV